MCMGCSLRSVGSDQPHAGLPVHAVNEGVGQSQVVHMRVRAHGGLEHLEVLGVLAHALADLAALVVEVADHAGAAHAAFHARSEEHTSELQSQSNLVCRLLLEKKKQQILAT